MYKVHAWAEKKNEGGHQNERIKGLGWGELDFQPQTPIFEGKMQVWTGCPENRGEIFPTPLVPGKNRKRKEK